ncbi:MAG: serine/threonine-protein kinase [Gemmatimonadetes bacterium]|nr:serine/threonine-protein kinase [Gemmatimonadota bacterium]
MSNEVLTRLTASLADRYRIERELGAGGMATVFLAHDLRHDRDVAIKVLHPDLGAALGGERFLSEIRTTARLQHPHILPLLDSGSADGLLYYVMPLVTGETLRARLEREKQLPIDDAIRIAREIADALGYAHGLGVIHRDIKPENILLQGGHATVADFGIALAVQQAGGHRMTQTGLSLGTPQYMSPEQAMGEKSIDARSDLYALAAVTYEMLVGEAPFTGPTVQAIVARVMTEEPRSLHTQRKAIPEYVEDAVLRALEKLPADRWSSAQEYADALQGSTTGSAPRGGTVASRARVVATARTSWRARARDPIVLGLLGIALVSLGLAAWKWRGVPPESTGVVRFAIPAPQDASSNTLGLNTLAISRDGRTLVYVGQSESRRPVLMIRTLSDVTPRALPGSEEANNPVFSPDGRWVAFVRGNQLFKIAVDGDRPQLLAPVLGVFNGMSWSNTGVILVSGNLAMYAVPEVGGQPRQLGKPDRRVGEVDQDAPLVVDEAGIFLYASTTSSAVSTSKLAMASLATGEQTVFDVPGWQPLGIVDGVLVYVASGGVIMGVPIDVRARKLTGKPVQLVGDISVNTTTGLARAALSEDGTLFYQTGTQSSQVVLAGVDGSSRVLLAEAREYAFPRLSPDGRRLAVAIGSTDRRDIWIYDLGAQTAARLTNEGTTNERPEWTPDGRRVLFRTDRHARSAIWWRPVDLSADATALIEGKSIDVFEAVISPDMRYVVYQLDTVGADILYRGLSGDTAQHVVSNAAAIETMPRLSPDGRWVAFDTDESGHSEVVVQPFPGPGGRIQVSSGGGSEPVWSHDGRRLFYRGDGHLMAATLDVAQSFGVARRDTLLADVYQYAANPHANYDAMADGTHFVFLKAAREGRMIVATNWKAAVRSQMKGRATE